MTGRPKVAVGVVHGDELATSFHQSYANMLMYDLTRGAVMAHDAGLISVRCGTDGLVASRNTVVERLLESDADWLLWIDSDMGFDPDSMYKLLAIADPQARPIVGGLCFASRQYAADGMGGFRTAPAPTIFELRPDDGGNKYQGGQLYPVNSLIRCAATGSAFILVHRSVFEAIGGCWYDRLPNTDGKLMGEDISFCDRATTAGFPVHVYTGVRTSHLKPQWVGEADYWAAVDAPPATEDVAVIVPVMGRPGNAEPFMRSLRASTGLATVYAIADIGDDETVEAWLAAGAQVVQGDKTTFAAKANDGYDSTKEPWLFFVGDDVRFYPGWLDHAQHVAASWNASVVGTNDLGTKRVTDGEHSTHLLIRRSYIEEVGASWDGPGVVCHEGYRHWYVDDEIVTAAKQRGAWQMALGSIVEHIHPLFGKADDDEIYRLGQSHADADRALFERRLADHA